MQVCEYQAKQLQEKIRQMEGILGELILTKEGLFNLKKRKKTLMPLGAGVFVKAEITETSEVVSSVGTGLFAEQGVKTVLEKIDREIEIYSKEIEKRGEEFTKLVEKLQNLNKKARKLAGGKKDVRSS